MNLGLGLALELQNGKFGSIYDGLIKSGATMILDPNRPSGKPFTKLSPRTLPNGVSNGEYLQRVSGDVVLQASDITSISNATNVTYILTPKKTDFIGYNNFATSANIAFKWGDFDNYSSGGFDNVANIGKVVSSANALSLFYIAPLGTTLEQARALLAGTVIRYELATPIDTLNSPFVNPLVDLANKVGKNLFDRLEVENEKGLDLVTGNVIALPGFRVSGFIEVSPSKIYFFPARISIRTKFYKADKTPFSATSDVPAVATSALIPPEVKFVRVTIENAININTFQIELGTVATTYEPYAKNNALLQNFIPSSADGYATIIAPNGKTVTVLNLDGTNSFGALASSDALNPIGTSDFVIADVIRTNSLKDQYLITKATSSEATTQYGVKITSTGNLVLILEGTSITLATGLLANTLYKILISRDNGTLRCELNGVQTYSQANTISLTAKANTLIGALSTIAGGTTQTGYANVSQGIKVFCKDHDFAKFKSEFYKLALKQYGL